MIYTFDIGTCQLTDSIDIGSAVEAHNSIGLSYDHTRNIFYRGIRDTITNDKVYVRLDVNFETIDTLAIIADLDPLSAWHTIDNWNIFEMVCDDKLVVDESIMSEYWIIDLITGVVDIVPIPINGKQFCDIINCNGQYYGFEQVSGDIYLLNRDDFTDRVELVGNFGDVCEGLSLECIPRCGMSDILMRSRLCEIQYYDMSDFSLISSCYPDIPCIEANNTNFGSLGLEYTHQNRMYLDLDTTTLYCDNVNASITIPCDTESFSFDFLRMDFFETYYPLDSLNIHIQDKSGLSLDLFTSSNIIAQQHGDKDILFNMGVFDNQEFKDAVHNSEIRITNFDLVQNPIIVEFQSWECGIKSAIATLSIYLEQSSLAGSDQVLQFCPDVGTIDLNMFVPPASSGGRWEFGSPLYTISEDDELRYIVDGSSCPDTATYTIIVARPADTLVQLEHLCFEESIVFDGIYIEQSGMYTKLEHSVIGCDSLVTELIVSSSPPPRIEERDTLICYGEVFVYQGNSYSSPQIVSSEFKDQMNCDSLEILIDIKFSPEVIMDSIIHMICYGDSIEYNGRWFDTSGKYDFEEVDNLSQCISREVHLDVSVSETPRFELVEENICAGDTLAFGGNNYSESGTYYNYIHSTLGCDSIINELHLTVEPPTSFSETTAHICDGEIFEFYGSFYTASGEYEYAEQDTSGCLVFLEELTLIVSPPIFEIGETQKICIGDSISFANRYVQEAGIYYDTIQNNKGCDSLLYRLDLSLFPEPVDQVQTRTICEGDSLLFGDIHIYNPGIYTDTLKGTHGCDSLLFSLELSHHRSPILYDESMTICLGDTINFGGRVISDEGFYQDSVLDNTTGCLSAIYSLTLEVSPALVVIEVDTLLCFGEVFSIEGIEYNNSDRIEIHLKNSNDCDSLHMIFNLEVMPNPLEESAIITLCPGEELWINGELLELPITIVDTLMTNNSCDSLYKSISYKVSSSLLVSEVGETTYYGNIGDTIILDANFLHPNVQLEWSPSDLVINSSILGQLIVSDTASYSLLATNEGCDTTIYFTIEIDSLEVDSMHSDSVDFGLFIPNVIYLNSETGNDIFYVQTHPSDIRVYDMVIYDRWGNPVFEAIEIKTNEKRQGWDATLRNTPVDSGVFVYWIYDYLNEEPIVGTVTVLR